MDTSKQGAPGWLFVLPWSLQHIGGVNQVVKSLVAEFRDGGEFSPQLLVTSQEGASGGTSEPDMVRPYSLNLWSPVDHHRPVRGLFSFFLRLPYRCWALRRIINKHNITVINPHYPELGSLVFLVLKKLRLFKGKFILSFHLSDVRSALLTTGLERRLWKIFVRGANHIVVVSNDLAKSVLVLDPTAVAKITTIYNGVDLDLFGPFEEAAGAQFSVADRGTTIVSIGAFVPRKGHDVLVRAFGHVLKKVPDARLVLVGGDGSEFEPLRELISSMSLANSVTLFKDVPHERVPKFLSQARLFVLASRRESFGLVVTEAAAAKVPVVCTNAEGVRELITNGVNGRLVEIDDHVALASAIIDVLEHPDDANRMANNFYEHVKCNLTWQHTYKAYLELSDQNTT